MENNLNNEIQLSGIPNNIPVEINKVKYNSAYVYKITIGKNGEQPFDSGKLHIAVSVSGSEAQGRWFPTTRQYDRAVHQTWNSENQTSYMNGAPIYSYYRQDDSNILTVAADDSFITWQICSGVDEPSQQISFDISSEFLNCDVGNVNLLFDIFISLLKASVRFVHNINLRHHYKYMPKFRIYRLCFHLQIFYSILLPPK